MNVTTWDVNGKRALRHGELQSGVVGRTIVPASASLDPGGEKLIVGGQLVSQPRGGVLAGRNNVAIPATCAATTCSSATPSAPASRRIRSSRATSSRKPSRCHRAAATRCSRRSSAISRRCTCGGSSRRATTCCAFRAPRDGDRHGHSGPNCGRDHRHGSAAHVAALGPHGRRLRRLCAHARLAVGAAGRRAEDHARLGDLAAAAVGHGDADRRCWDSRPRASVRIWAPACPTWSPASSRTRPASSSSNAPPSTRFSRKWKSSGAVSPRRTRSESARASTRRPCSSVVSASSARTPTSSVRAVNVETQQVEGARDVTCERCKESNLPAAVSALQKVLVK